MMSETEVTPPTNNEQWAVVELMGHAQTAGRISRPADFGGLLRVDVPCDDAYRTEFYGMTAIYSIKLVSEEIARAYATEQPQVISYDTPIVPRSQYENAIALMQNQNRILQHNVDELTRRLTLVNSLPEPVEEQTESHNED